MNTFFVRGMTAMLSSLMVAQSAIAQQSIADRRAPTDELRAGAVFARRVTVRLDGVDLKTAVKTIGQRAGVRVQYTSDELERVTHPITLHMEHVPFGTAMERVLQGTGLQVVVLDQDLVGIKQGGGAPVRMAGVIRGRVRDAATQQPVRGASILLDDATIGVTTDEDGLFQIAHVSAGDHHVSVRLIGYRKQTKHVTVAEGQTETMDFSLPGSTNVLDQVVVTGTVAPTELKAVPNAMTVITAKQIEARGITRIDQLFRGDVPGLFAVSPYSGNALDQVLMFSRGATSLVDGSVGSAGTVNHTNPIKTYLDGVELADPKYLSQIDPASIERIEILTGPQASTIYGSNAINGVMQIFTKRGGTTRPQASLHLTSGVAQNNFSNHLAPSHVAELNVSGLEGRWSYQLGGSWDYTGAWTPAKQTQRLGDNGGIRTDIGKFTIDVSGRYGLTMNKQRDDGLQGQANLKTTGIFDPSQSTTSLQSQSQSLRGRTFGFSISYRPYSWWSHEGGVGSDAASTESIQNQPQYVATFDTALAIQSSVTSRTSEHYTTTAQIPVASLATMHLTLGGDHWRSTSDSWNAFPRALTGTLASPSISRTRPLKNQGAFVQGQLGFMDALFFTYGVRADWNPTFGKKARVAPGRFGLSYARDIGDISAKLRGSYGRSIRPPNAGQALGFPMPALSFINQFGPFDLRLANPELGPEYQQGGEGGLELYVGNRGSVSITRYNQTVDNLISNVNPVDSVRSLTGTPDDDYCASSFRDAGGHCFWYQGKYLNIGSIRNQGWELQSSVNMGPFSMHSTYSWTKSRVIGITPRYRTLLQTADPIFEPGRPFDFLPEHTWALGLSYAHARSAVLVSISGVGTRYVQRDLLSYGTNNRLVNTRPRMSLPVYRPLGHGYATTDVNASHHLGSRVDVLLQVNNLMDYYPNDYSFAFATMGRQSQVGARIRL